MAIKDRVAQSHKNKNRVREIQELKFIQSTELDNLKALTLDQLEHRFDEIGQQAQLLQGRILLEARSRFRSDEQFGIWCKKSPYLSSLHQSSRTRLINLAKFFKDDREIDKISITAAYEISAPVNADVAVEVYEFAKGKNLPVAEVKRQIAIKKGLDAPLNPVSDNPPVIESPVVEQEPERTVFSFNPPAPAVSQVLIPPAIVGSETEHQIKVKLLEDLSPVSAIVGIRLLQDCIKELQSRMYKP